MRHVSIPIRDLTSGADRVVQHGHFVDLRAGDRMEEVLRR